MTTRGEMIPAVYPDDIIWVDDIEHPDLDFDDLPCQDGSACGGTLIGIVEIVDYDYFGRETYHWSFVPYGITGGKRICEDCADWICELALDNTHHQDGTK
jgi:hypothetical protein